MKIEAISLIVYTNYVIIIAIANIFKRRDIIVANIPDTYLNVMVDEFLLLKIINE